MARDEVIFCFREADQEKRQQLQHTVILQEALDTAQKLPQILNNLISNSMKYSEPGAEIRVSVREFDFQQYNKYQIVVEDTGIGMSQAFLEHLFEPYARETQFSSHAATGTGLGMPIVKSLVQQMSGEIMVESQQGKGSKFTVILPMPAVSEEEPAAPVQPPPCPPGELAGLHILLAEDNELNMEIAAEILSMNGVTVTQAYNGVQALHLFEEAAPDTFDAILMDMQMPEMDGCQATQAIRMLDRPDAGDIPIIAATANAVAEDIVKTTDAGMNGHISKPIDFQALCQTLQVLIQQRRQDRAPKTNP